MRIDPRKLERALLKNQMDWTALVQRAGISPVTLFYLRKGIVKKNQFKVIYKISNALGVNPETLLEDQED